MGATTVGCGCFVTIAFNGSLIYCGCIVDIFNHVGYHTGHCDSRPRLTHASCLSSDFSWSHDKHTYQNMPMRMHVHTHTSHLVQGSGQMAACASCVLDAPMIPRLLTRATHASVRGLSIGAANGARQSTMRPDELAPPPEVPGEVKVGVGEVMR